MCVTDERRANNVAINQNVHTSWTAEGTIGKDGNPKRNGQNSNKKNGNGNNKKLKGFRPEGYTPLNDILKNIFLAIQGE